MSDRFDVLVVGAGPAGLAASLAATERGLRVGLIDLQPRPGGQVWRHDVGHAAPAFAQRHVAAVQKPGTRLKWFARSTVVAAESDGLLVEGPNRSRWLRYGRLVIATGARELLLPFPGWTLPGVTGAGGLQALAKQGWPLNGQRVLVSGTGPLLWATAATAKRHGARVLGIHEQAARSDVARFAAGLWRWPGKIAQAVRLRVVLMGVPYRCASRVVAASGDERLREVEIESPCGRERIACEALATGYGLVPNVRLARTLGCRLDDAATHPRVVVDALQRTSLKNVYAAGEACGIGGRDVALVEGVIAGYAAAGAVQDAMRWQRRRDHARRFAAHLGAHFALDAHVLNLAQTDTIVCRCEDVLWRDLEGYDSARAAKLATRCGMGPCQGWICGAALAALGRFPYAGQRAPLFPARLETLTCAEGDSLIETTPDR